MRKVWYLLAILLLQITGIASVNAQYGCSILDMKVSYPSPVSVDQTFTVGVSITVGCAINSYLRSDISANLGTLSVQSSLTDSNGTFAHTGTYLHQLTLTSVGDWSVQGAVYIIDSLAKTTLAASMYHYNINVFPQVSLNNETVTTESICQPVTVTSTQTFDFTTTQTTSYASTIWIQTENTTTVTSTITTQMQLISNTTLYTAAAVLTVLLMVVLVGTIVGRRAD